MRFVVRINKYRHVILWLPLFVGIAFIVMSCSGTTDKTIIEPIPIPVMDLPTRETILKEDNVIRVPKVVTEVVDSVTIVVFDGEKSSEITMLGLSLMEVEQDIMEKGKEFLRFLLLGKEISVELDPFVDPHLRQSSMYIYVDGIMVNKELVLKGLARVGPNNGLLYSEDLAAAQESSQQNKLGIWFFEPSVSDQMNTLNHQVEKMGCGTLPCRP